MTKENKSAADLARELVERAQQVQDVVDKHGPDSFQTSEIMVPFYNLAATNAPTIATALLQAVEALERTCMLHPTAEPTVDLIFGEGYMAHMRKTLADIKGEKMKTNIITLAEELCKNIDNPEDPVFLVADALIAATDELVDIAYMDEKELQSSAVKGAKATLDIIAGLTE